MCYPSGRAGFSRSGGTNTSQPWSGKLNPPKRCAQPSPTNIGSIITMGVPTLCGMILRCPRQSSGAMPMPSVLRVWMRRAKESRPDCAARSYGNRAAAGTTALLVSLPPIVGYRRWRLMTIGTISSRGLPSIARKQNGCGSLQRKCRMPISDHRSSTWQRNTTSLQTSSRLRPKS
jgi:hypothetical protein